MSRITLALAVAWITSSMAMSAQGVRWAGRVDVALPDLLHAPDDRTIDVALTPTLSSFSPTFRYPRLPAFVRVSARDWARTDVIAFEGNGGHAVGPENSWESSTWTFTDGTNTYVAKFNGEIGRSSDPSVVANGSIIGVDGSISSGGDAYRAFFGICTPNPDNRVVSYILFDLDAVRPRVNAASPTFRIKIQNGPPRSINVTTPDPDAVGVVATCP